MLVDSALLLLLGLILAGFVHEFLHERNINRFLHGGKRTKIFKIALIGIPLPLCSCSVVPLAYQLRRSGVGKGGVATFLISTPETGVDSILLTYSLMDPVMTIARPISAFLAAITSGITETFFPDNDKPFDETIKTDSCNSGCGCSTKDTFINDKKWYRKFYDGIHYAFTDLLGDLAFYLLIGYLLAGLVSALVGTNGEILPTILQNRWGSYAGALIIGVPLYICATSSTPLAAALLAAGFSPGAILVFLLVGPATNIASLAMVSKVLKGWATIRYLVVIIVMALICGITVDWIYNHFHITEVFQSSESEEGKSLVYITAAIVLSVAILYSISKKSYNKYVKS